MLDMAYRMATDPVCDGESTAGKPWDGKGGAQAIVNIDGLPFELGINLRLSDAETEAVAKELGRLLNTPGWAESKGLHKASPED